MPVPGRYPGYRSGAAPQAALLRWMAKGQSLTEADGANRRTEIFVININTIFSIKKRKIYSLGARYDPAVTAYFSFQLKVDRPRIALPTAQFERNGINTICET